MRVAIADDDPIVCSSLSTILEATGTADVAMDRQHRHGCGDPI